MIFGENPGFQKSVLLRLYIGKRIAIYITGFELGGKFKKPFCSKSGVD